MSRVPTRSTFRSDDGSATIWVLACVALVAVVGVALVVRTTAVLARHRVQDAADLVALAVATGIGTTADPCASARTVANANAVRLDACAVELAADGRSGSARVQVESVVHLPLVGTTAVRGSARAARDPPH